MGMLAALALSAGSCLTPPGVVAQRTATPVAEVKPLKTTFLDKGIPVFLGEYGAVNQDGFEDYRRYWMEYVIKVAVDRGVLPVYWDNGAQGSGQDQFAMFDRNTGAVLQPELLKAMRRAATDPYKLADIALPKPGK